jgi:glycosyltransferase involved in cell wall biosynthesis
VLGRQAHRGSLRAILRSLWIVALAAKNSHSRRLRGLDRQREPLTDRRVSLHARRKSRGRVLLCYLKEPVEWSSDDERLNTGHPNKWDSWTLADILVELGWDLDVIDWDDWDFRPTRSYDAVIALDGNGARLTGLMRPNSPTLLLHLTTAAPEFNNAAEESRLDALTERRGATIRPQRQLARIEGSEAALSEAQACTLTGNEWAASTYGSKLRSKIRPIGVTTVPDAGTVQFNAGANDLLKNDFLWYFGGGAVHKGLDITLEAFSSLNALKLNVVGDLESEPDFLWEYRRELFLTRNIRYHGYLTTHSDELDRVLSESSFVVAPSCSEGTSTALAICIASGMIPILTREAGVSLPQGVGIVIEQATPRGVMSAVSEAAAMPTGTRNAMAAAAAKFGRESFSRSRYRDELTKFFSAELIDAGKRTAQRSS